jgi:hypothetical protein
VRLNDSLAWVAEAWIAEARLSEDGFSEAMEFNSLMEVDSLSDTQLSQPALQKEKARLNRAF